jgi:hypothetical protein
MRVFSPGVGTAGLCRKEEKVDRAAIDEFSTARICRLGGRIFPVLTGFDPLPDDVLDDFEGKK